jgi:hypothetical protein
MKATSGFTAAGNAEKPPFDISLVDGEELIGWYRNPPPWDDSWMLFTSTAIWTIERERKERIELREIVSYQSPTEPTDVTGLRVCTKDGFRFLRAAGCYGPGGKYKDFLALMMVLRAVIRSDSVP